MLALALVGVSVAFVEVPAMALLAEAVEALGGGGYARAFALQDVCTSLGFLLGPLAATSLLTLSGGDYFRCFAAAAVACILVVPLLAGLRSFRRDAGGRGFDPDGRRAPRKATQERLAAMRKSLWVKGGARCRSTKRPRVALQSPVTPDPDAAQRRL